MESTQGKPLISLKNIVKKYDDKYILNDLSFDFYQGKFYAIVGRSGIGKTTLLNVIMNCDTSYTGERFFDDLRNENRDIAYFRQDSYIIKELTVSENIRLFLDGVASQDNTVSEALGLDILNFFSLTELKDVTASELSGGERQRLSLAMIVSMNKSVILCDEPTANLDSQNEERIFEYLRNISADRLVICVSHEEEAIGKYADYICRLVENGQLKLDGENVFFKTKKKISLSMKNKANIKSLRAPFISGFVKSRKKNIKNQIFYLVFSLCSILMFLSFQISFKLDKVVDKSFLGILGDNSLIAKRKEDTKELFSIEESDVELFESLNEVETCSRRYEANFEEVFKDENDLYDSNMGIMEKIEGYSFRNFADFKLLSHHGNMITYPSIDNPMKSDSIILSLGDREMKKLCIKYGIPSSFDSLGNLLKNEVFTLTLRLANYSWSYRDEQAFRLVAVTPSLERNIYVEAPSFLQILVKESMRYPTSIYRDRPIEFPWVFKERTLLFFKGDRKNFFDSILTEDWADYYYFENAEIDRRDSVYVYKSKEKRDFSSLQDIFKREEILGGYYFTTKSGYVYGGNRFYSGFFFPTYFSFAEEQLLDFSEDISKIAIEEEESIENPIGIASSYYLNPSDNQVKFKPYNEIDGSFKSRGERVFISDKLYDSLISSGRYDGKLYMAINDTNIGGVRKFARASLIIAGVVDDDSLSIYGDENFFIEFFRDNLRSQLNTYELDSLVVSLESTLDQGQLQLLKKEYGGFIIEYPFLSLKETVQGLIDRLEYLFSILIYATLACEIFVVFSLTLFSLNASLSDIKAMKELGIADTYPLLSELSVNFFRSLFVLTIFIPIYIFINRMINRAFLEYLNVNFGADFLFEMIAMTFSLSFFGIFVSTFLAFLLIKRTLKDKKG
jgi:ABC-type multidrug transport system ATPase subunit